MRAVLTRVKSASVTVDGKTIGQIGQGFLILLGITDGDTVDDAVYLADKIEPSRRSYPALEEVRTMAETDLLAATIRSLRSTLDYVAQRGGTAHPATRRALEWLERMQREKEKKEAHQTKQ